MKIFTVLRCLYGRDFIQYCINSIKDYSDKIFIFYDDKPWCNIEGYNYKNKYYKYPKKFDDILDKIKEMNNSKIILQHDHVDNCNNQFTHLINDLIIPKYGKPNIFIIIEVDCVFRKDQIETSIKEFIERKYINATTRQVEIWKGLNYRVPERNYRIGSVFWNMDSLDKLPNTGRQAEWKRNIKTLTTHVHNFGFAVSEKSMWNKHSIALGLQGKLGDMKNGINEDWYENKWLNWNPEMSDLEMSKGKEYLIKNAIPYDIKLLPESIYEDYNKLRGELYGKSKLY